MKPSNKLHDLLEMSRLPPPTPDAPAAIPLPLDRRRRLRRWLWMLLLPSALGAGLLIYILSSGDSRLTKIIAKLDHQEPGWRLLELEAQRIVIPKEQNSADQVAAAAVKRSAGMTAAQEQQLDDIRGKISPEVQLPASAISLLRREPWSQLTLREEGQVELNGRCLTDLARVRIWQTPRGNVNTGPVENLSGVT